MKISPKYEINQKVFKFPEFKFDFKFTPSKVKRRVIDEIADGVVDIQYYIDNEIEPIEERKLFANEKELALVLALKLQTVVNELKDKYGLVETPTMVHNPIPTKSENNIQDSKEESEEEMRKQGYYKNQDGEWEWDRNLAVSQDYAEEMQEMKRLDGYYDTSTLSKEEQKRLHDLTKKYGLSDERKESDYVAIDKLVNFICETFKDFGFHNPLDNDEINTFIRDFFRDTINHANYVSKDDLIKSIGKIAIKIIKR